MNDNLKTVLVIIGIFLGVPLALLFARDWFTRLLKKKTAGDARPFTERLQQPNFSAIEKQFGRPLPACVQALYADHRELLRAEFEVAAIPDAAPEHRWYVAFYKPADEQSLRDAWPGLEKYFAFANDGCGNDYLIDPKEEDPAVFFHDHETGELSRVCDRFTEFMKWPRLETEA